MKKYLILLSSIKPNKPNVLTIFRSVAFLTLVTLVDLGLCSLLSAAPTPHGPVLALDNPIVNFARVTPQIYRGGRPHEAGLKYLKKLGVKTVINLENKEEKIDEELRFASALGLTEISHPMSSLLPPQDLDVDQILSDVNDSSLYPLFIHCHHGRDRTGLIVGLYRVFGQSWGPRKAYNEMLDLGFRPVLYFLNHYFEERTGMEDFFFSHPAMPLVDLTQAGR